METFLYHELVIRGVLFSFLFYFIVSPRLWRIRPTRLVFRPARLVHARSPPPSHIPSARVQPPSQASRPPKPGPHPTHPVRPCPAPLPSIPATQARPPSHASRPSKSRPPLTHPVHPSPASLPRIPATQVQTRPVSVCVVCPSCVAFTPQ